MNYTLFNRHPQMKEVMAIRNAETNLRACDEKLNSCKILSTSNLNLMAIDIYRGYRNLIEFIYLRQKEQVPLNSAIKKLMEGILSGEPGEEKEMLLSTMDVVMLWETTLMPLENIVTTREEVEKTFEILQRFYVWVDNRYFSNPV